MTTKTISTLSDFDKFFEKQQSDESLKNAVSKYLEKGGVIRIAESSTKPKILYPTKRTLDVKIAEMQTKLNFLKKEETEWNKNLGKAQRYELEANVKKLSHPIYWKHMMKYHSDPDYKKDADLIDLPVHLVSDKRWQPLVEMFVTNIDYRKQLTETVQTSIAYSEERKVARFARKQQDFRKGECKRKVDELNEKITKIKSQISNYHKMKNWV